MPHAEKEQKTEFTKKGSRFFYYGQIEHDEYERKKIGEFYEYVAKNKIVYDKEFYGDQRLLLFLQSNSYKPKETLEAMGNHLAFRKQYLPVDFTRVEKLIVTPSPPREAASSTPAAATATSAPSSSSTPPSSTSRTSRWGSTPPASSTRRSSRTCSSPDRWRTG